MTKKFRDQLSVYVFTTRQVLLEKSPIVYASHDTNGDWQFFGDGDAPEVTDAMLISLGEMITHDPSILEIADPPLGSIAMRPDSNSKWHRKKAR